MSWGDFLNSDGFGDGGDRMYLREWRKSDGFIIVWVHTASRFNNRLFHLIPYEREIEKDGKKKKVIFYFAFVCHESVEARNRKLAPKHCPVCRLIELLSEDGTVSDDEVVFQAQVGDTKRDKISTKADFCGLEGGSWSGSFTARQQIVLVVVDNDHVDDGLRVATETFTLGEALKKAVKQEMDVNGPEEGDPHQNPYAFKWKYNPKAKLSTDYYSVYAYRKEELTAEIAELLAEPPVDVSEYTMPGDTQQLREIFDNHIMIDVDMDELFDNVIDDPNRRRSIYGSSNDDAEETPKPKTRKRRTAMEDVGDDEPAEEPAEEPADGEVEQVPCDMCEGKGELKRGKKTVECPFCDGTGLVDSEGEGDGEDEQQEEEEPPPPPKKKAPQKRRAAKKKPDPEPEPEDEMAQCPTCKKLVSLSAPVCPHCGAEFEDD
jgi:hypothetical protein